LLKRKVEGEGKSKWWKNREDTAMEQEWYMIREGGGGKGRGRWSRGVGEEVGGRRCMGGGFLVCIFVQNWPKCQKAAKFN
jgi:hypothetical protein